MTTKAICCPTCDDNHYIGANFRECPTCQGTVAEPGEMEWKADRPGEAICARCGLRGIILYGCAYCVRCDRSEVERIESEGRENIEPEDNHESPICERCEDPTCGGVCGSYSDED